MFGIRRIDAQEFDGWMEWLTGGSSYVGYGMTEARRRMFCFVVELNFHCWGAEDYFWDGDYF